MPRPRINTLPAIDKLPKAARPLAEELLELRRRRGDLARKVADLKPSNHTGSRDDLARKADAQLLIDAARSDAPIEGIGTPNADALEAERKALADQQRAVDGALLQVSDQLHAAIVGDIDTATATATDALDTATGRYVAAVEELREARREHLEAKALVRFVTWVRDHDNGGPSVEYATGNPNLKVGIMGQPVSEHDLLDAFRTEAAGDAERKVTTWPAA